MTALALRDDQIQWDDRQLAVLRSVGIGEDVSEGELTAFLHECQTRKLDPFTKQIYLIGRWDKQARRKVYRSQTGIDGFRLIARRAADKAGESIEYEDTVWCDLDGKWTDVWLSDKAPAACKVVVLRNGKRFPVTARYAAYVQVNSDQAPTGLWAKMPDSQLAKCCEALALRKAFPEELGGIYTEEEMAQADNPAPVRAEAEVIREEPAVRVVRNETAQAAAKKDDGWLDAAIVKASGDLAADDCRALWKESAAKVHAGQITKADAKRVQDLLKARLEDLADQARKAAALDDGDPWAVKIEALASAVEADWAVSEVLGHLRHEQIDQARADRLTAAIRARFPGASAEAAAA
jgi:phage recombination protein Bet